MPIIHAFGPFRLETGTESLFRGGERLSVGRRAVALLRVMVERAGVPVTKQALIAAAWSGLAVENSNLSVQIAALRRALGEEPGAETWIETLPRRGYRFVGPSVTTSNDASGHRGPTPRSGGALEGVRQLPLPDRPSIAVRPFTNLSADSGQEYFVDGVTEDIIAALSKWRWFLVIARNASFVFKGRAVSAKEIGQQLGVRYVLEGSVRKAGSRIRVNAQLIDADSGFHIWAERFDRDFTDVFALRDELTRCVATAIEPALAKVETAQARRKTPGQLAAWDHYLRGLWHHHQFTPDEAVKAIESFRQALDLDPSLADADAGTALTVLHQLMRRGTPPHGAEMAEVIQTAKRALTLDGDNLTTHFALSFAFSHSDDPDAGFKVARRATELNDNYAPGHNALALASVFLGRLEEGLIAIDLALRLSPSDPYASFRHARRGAILYLLGRYPEAIAAARQSLALNWFHVAPRVLAASYAQLGLIDHARKAVGELVASDQGDKSIAAVIRPFVRVEDREHWTQGLRAAGLPEL